MARPVSLGILAALAIVAAPARANDPIVNFENLMVATPAGKPLSQAQVRDAIAAGMLIAQRMNYRAAEATIHPNYNRWARELVDSIDRAIYRTRAE